MSNLLDPDFGKPHKARILIALGLCGAGIILATDSEWVSEEVSMISNNIDDIGISISPEHDAPALVLWEGDLKVVCYNPEDGGETEYDGECRSVHGLELAQLLDMHPPTNLFLDEPNQTPPGIKED